MGLHQIDQPARHKIKFPVQKQPEFINELREKVKSHFQTRKTTIYGNTNMVLKTVFMLVLYLAPFILMLIGIIHTLPGLLTGWVFMGLGMSGVGLCIMHDANHRSYSKNMKVNKWLSKSMFILGGFPLIWQYQHNTLHHGFTNIDGHDEDIDPGAILRFSPHKPLYKIHRYQQIYAWFFYAIMTLSWVTIKEFRQYFEYKKTGVQLSGKTTMNQLLGELILSKILYHSVFLVLPLMVLPFAWYWILLGFLAMQVTCGLILSTVFSTAHVVPDSEYPLPDETGSMENNWAIHQLLTTSDFSPRSRIFSWLIGGLNYQVVHHLFPNICHVHYRKISNLVKDTAKKYGLPYHVYPTFIVAVSNHYKMLKLLGRQTSEIYQPHTTNVSSRMHHPDMILSK